MGRIDASRDPENSFHRLDKNPISNQVDQSEANSSGDSDDSSDDSLNEVQERELQKLIARMDRIEELKATVKGSEDTPQARLERVAALRELKQIWSAITPGHFAHCSRTLFAHDIFRFLKCLKVSFGVDRVDWASQSAAKDVRS